MTETTSDAKGAVGRHRSPDRTVEDVRLPAHLRWPLLALLVGIFLFGGKAPMWENPFDIDQAIWFSYAPIPVLVGVLLWWSKRFSAATLFLNTMEIVLLKFALTYSIAMVAWATFVKAPPPTEITPTAPPVVHDVVQEPPSPTPWPEEKRGRISGQVLDEQGVPSANTFVYVSGGLDDIVFERPAETNSIVLGKDGFVAELIIVRRWQPLTGRSADGRLHTVFIEGEERSFRATPLMPSGDPSKIAVHALRGVVPMGCSAHKQRAHIAVLHHPHHTRTGSDGSFTLTDVPALDVTVAAWTPKAKAKASGRLEASGNLALQLELKK